MKKKKEIRKIAKKKKTKQAKKRQNRTAKTTHEVRIIVAPAPAGPTAKDLEPVKDGGKYMIPKTWMSERQVIKMVQQTPPQHVYKRKARGGGMWDYVTGTYVQKVLNFVFGWNWDFEIVEHGKEADQVWVLGKLTVKDNKGNTITKTQFGRADLKFRKDNNKMLDFGNDLKAAGTDALKKAASMLGIASDIYGRMEFKDEAEVEIKEVKV
ncbi:MAG: Rad52/Rad22 family DNA repair protein, partial [Patescibacteria group bacterium]